LRDIIYYFCRASRVVRPDVEGIHFMEARFSIGPYYTPKIVVRAYDRI
jgi:hypothetical protein